MKPDVIDPSGPAFPMRTPNVTDVLRFTFCQRTLPLDLHGGNADDPDYVERLLIPCQYGYGHDGKCEFPMPNRTVGR